MVTQKPESNKNIAAHMDFMINDPTLTEAETVTKCQQAMQIDPASLFVKPCYVQAVLSTLRVKNVQIGTVIGGQGGANTTQIKVAESKRSLTEGATLLATPINVGYIREKRYEALANDLHAVSGIAHMNFAKVEVKFNPDWVETHEILAAAQIAQSADIDILSFPISHRNGKWDFGLLARLQDEIDETIQLKCYVQNLSYSDVETLVEKGLTRLGIESLDFI